MNMLKNSGRTTTGHAGNGGDISSNSFIWHNPWK